MIKHRLLEIQTLLREQYNINATYDEDLIATGEPDYSLEWWGHDGSLNTLEEWNNGEIEFYKIDSSCNRLIYHSVYTLEDFEAYWDTFPLT